MTESVTRKTPPVIKIQRPMDINYKERDEVKKWDERKAKYLKENSFVVKDPNFVPFRLTNPRTTRSKSPPLTHNNRSPPPKTAKNELKPKLMNRDFANCKTTTDFFSKLYIENKKLANTFTENFGLTSDKHLKIAKNESFPLIPQAWNIKKPNSENSKKETDLYSEKILGKVKKISLISSILGENCYEIIDLLENESKSEALIKEYIKDMKFAEFIEIQQNTMSKLMKVFREVILEKVLLKEGEGLMEVGTFLVERLGKLLEDFKEYFNKYQELFSNMRLLQENELKIENGFYEGLYYLIDSYNLYFHENQLFGKTKPTIEAYVYSIQQFKRELNKDSRNQKSFKLYDDLESVFKGLMAKIGELKDEVKAKEFENKKLSEVYEEKIKKNKEDHMLIILEKRKELLGMSDLSEKAPIKQEILIMNKTLEEVYKKQLKDNEKERKELSESFSKVNAKCKRYKDQISKMTNDLSNYRAKKIKDMQDKIVECNFYKENFIEKSTNHLKNLLTNPSENIVSAFKQSREWASALITLLLNEKSIADFQEEAEKRPRETLQNFIVQWFLRRFGNRNIAEIFLKDFLLSLKTLSSKPNRFRIFSELSNIDWGNGAGDKTISNTGQSIKDAVRSRFMSLNESFKIFMKIISSFNERQYKEKNGYYLFMPNILIKGQDLMPLDAARSILETILLEENMNEDKIREAMIQLKTQSLVFPDESYSSDDEPRSEAYHQNHQNQADKEQYIRFDDFSKFLLDFYFEYKYVEIDGLFAAMKLKNTMKSDGLITFDDFATTMAQHYPKRSLRWMETAYHALVDGIKSDATPLILSLRGILPLHFNEKSACENFSKNPNFFLNSNFNSYLHYISVTLNEKYEVEAEEVQLISPLNQKNQKLQRVPTNNSVALPLSKKKQSVVTLPKTERKTMKNIETGKTGDSSKAFNKDLVATFDCISSLALLEETYKIVKHMLIQSERNNPNLMSLHEDFKTDMARFPSNISKLRTYEFFSNYEKKDVMSSAETNWKRFRNLLFVCFNLSNAS